MESEEYGKACWGGGEGGEIYGYWVCLLLSTPALTFLRGTA